MRPNFSRTVLAHGLHVGGTGDVGAEKETRRSISSATFPALLVPIDNRDRAPSRAKILARPLRPDPSPV